MLVQTRAVALLCKAAEMCDDDTRLQRVVPYLLVSGPLELPITEHSGGCSMGTGHHQEVDRLLKSPVPRIDI